jgi:hypothetical protein
MLVIKVPKFNFDACERAIQEAGDNADWKNRNGHARRRARGRYMNAMGLFGIEPAWAKPAREPGDEAS